MSSITRIHIENIKGKKDWTIPFVNLNPNHPNVVVAPNGYGKSTLTTAFKEAAHGRIKLKDNDYYKKDKGNHPKLELEIIGNNAGVYTSTDTSSGISDNISIYVINSSLYAYSRKSKIGGKTIVSSDLKIEDIIIYHNIPEKKELDYRYSDIKSFYGNYGKLFLNIGKLINDNIDKLLSVEMELKKCISQVRIQNAINNFLNSVNATGTVQKIKSSISQGQVNILLSNTTIQKVINQIDCFSHKPKEWCDIDKYFSFIQICYLLKEEYDRGNCDLLKNIFAYHEYLELRDILDKRLTSFNTTGRELKTIVENGSLLVRFERAQSMSNGERDVLSFIVEITKAEMAIKKNVGILIIDEVFDYLDGSNMLAVQFYLSRMIDEVKKEGKELYPILFTHLDPNVFSNYYFKQYKVHYISAKGNIKRDSEIVKMLRIRESNTISEEDKKNMERYYLHYSNCTYTLPDSICSQISSGFCDDNKAFRNKLYKEVQEKYLQELDYNPVMVLSALRIKIEDYLYKKLPSLTSEIENVHKVINKIAYAEENGIDIPEEFYLLQPLYNDGMHLRGEDYQVDNKIKSAYLKTDNKHIKRMIRMIFEM